MNPILNGRSSLIALVLAWAYFPTLGDLWHKWMNDPQYSHGVLVPFFCAYLVWQRRERTDRFSRPALVSGFVLLGIGVACRIYSAGLLFLSLDGFSILPTLAGIALILGGWSLVKWVWPGLLFLVFMVPLPYTAERMMGAELQKVATLASTWLLQCFGQPAIAEGNTILIREIRLGVVEACSGLRMLMTFLAFAVGAVMLMQRSWVEKGIVLISAAPIALFTNVVRITGTGLAYAWLRETDGREAVLTFIHDFNGWLMMPLGLGILLMELWILNRLLIEAPKKKWIV